MCFFGDGATNQGAWHEAINLSKLWRRRDPIPRLAKHLLEEGIADQARLDAIHREVKEEVQAAMRFAEESPEPDAAALYEDLFAESPEELVRDGSESAN